MKITGKRTHTANNVYTGGITPKHEKLGVYSKKDMDSVRNILFALAIGAIGVLIALVLELLK